MLESLTFVGDYLPTAQLDLPQAPAATGVVANLECAAGPTRKQPTKAYPVVLGEDAVDHVARSRLGAVSLANNHSHDAGVSAFDDWARLLEARAGTQVYGTRARPYAAFEVAGRRVAVVGCLEPCRARGPRIFPQEQVERLVRRLSRGGWRVIVTPHWGKEGEYAFFPSPAQRRLAKRWVRAGADGILGHHPHTLHGRERMRDRPVYYSLGNALFDHEEGRGFPLTRLGLCVRWCPGAAPPDDTWRETFLWREDDGVRELPADAARVCARFLDRISGPLASCRPAWSARPWARAVGPTYMAKSRASWERRWRAHRLRTIPPWTGWQIHPTTRILRRGEMRADTRWAGLAQALDEALRS